MGDGLYNDSVIYKCLGDYSVRWDGKHQHYTRTNVRAATLWGPDVNGRICRMAAYFTLKEAVDALDAMEGAAEEAAWYEELNRGYAKDRL